MKTSTPNEHPNNDNEEIRFGYEIEQALLRKRFKEPSGDEEWKRLEARIVAYKRRKRLVRFYWISTLGTAAVLLLAFLLPWMWQEQTSLQSSVILCEAQPHPVITISEQSNIQGSRASSLQILPGQAPVSKERVLLSDKQADFTGAVDSASTTVITIPRGQVYQLVLSDSTRVWMNADSKLYFPSRFSGATREVKLEGEAYFQVAKDAKHPFIIHTQNVITEVLGTEFGMQAYPDCDTHVTLVEGSVKVEMPTLGKEVLLEPGQDILCTDSTYAITEVDTRYCALWKEGRLYFDDVSLQEILYSIGRHYNLTIEMENNPLLMQTRLHFVIDRDESITQIIEHLNMFGYMYVTLNQNTIKIKEKK